MGMLLYLEGHARSNIASVVNCYDYYMFAKNNSHELEVKRIGCYLEEKMK